MKPRAQLFVVAPASTGRPVVARRAGLLASIGLALVAGCGNDAARTPAPAQAPASDLYRSDIESLCDVLVRSGAEQMAPNDRTLTTAQWLAANLKTEDARKYLVSIQPLVGEPKAAALESEAKRTGLTRCALAEEWRRAVPL